MAFDKLLTVREVAARLECSEQTVRRLARRAILPATRVGPQLRFAQADVESYRALRASQKPRPAGPVLRGRASAADYLTRLQLLTGVLAQCSSPEQAADLVLGQCVGALDASGGIIYLTRDGRTLEIACSLGYPPGMLDAWQEVPLDAALPVPEVIRSGEPRFIEAAELLLASYPGIAGTPIANAAWACIPLMVEAMPIGGMLLAFSRPRTFTRDDRAFLLALAQQCAQTIARVRLFMAERAARVAAERAAMRTAVLQSITAALSDPHTPDQIAEIVMADGMRVLGAVAGALSLLNADGTFSIIRMIGYPPEVVDAWVGQRYSADLDAPIPDAVRARAPIWLGTHEALVGRYPHLARQLSAQHSGAWATVPLMVDDRALGGMTFLFAQPQAFTPTDRRFMLALAQQCAQAIDRARLHAAEQHARAEADAARQRMAMLAEVSVELAASLDSQTTLDTLAHLLVPRLADWCVIDMYADDGHIQTMVVAHADPAREQIGWEMVRRYPINPDAPGGTAAVLRTGQPELVPEITDEMIGLIASDATHARLLRGLGLRSSLCVALVARGRALGTIALVAAESGRRYSHADLPFMEDLARRAALAIDNARLYRASQEAVRMRDTFFSVAAHELKTPLTSLLGQAQLLERRASGRADASPRDLNAARVIVEQARRLNTMILAMLDSARLEHGQLSIEREPVDLALLARRVAGEIEPMLTQHTISVVIGEQPLLVIGDAIRLEQVLQNLLGNAIKYSPAGGAVQLRLARVGGQVHIAVQDEGLGIPQSALPQLFQRFYRAANVDAQHISGMGIGLYVVREIVSLHGGTVAVESVEGSGSTFSVFLPLAEQENGSGV